MYYKVLTRKEDGLYSISSPPICIKYSETDLNFGINGSGLFVSDNYSKSLKLASSTKDREVWLVECNEVREIYGILDPVSLILRSVIDGEEACIQLLDLFWNKELDWPHVKSYDKSFLVCDSLRLVRRLDV